MQLKEIRSFEFRSKKYEIRVYTTKNGYKVAVYLDNKRVNPFIYNVDFETDSDFKDLDTNSYKHFMDLAQSDVEKRIWEKLLEIH